MRTHIRRWGFFNVVGLAGFVVQLGVIAFLTRIGGWHYVPATAVAMQIVIAQNYVAHSRWTWADRPARTSRERLVRPLRYQGAKTLSLGVNVALTALFVGWVGLPPEAANALAVAACAILNYMAADRLIFTGAADAAADSPPVPR